MPETTKLHDLSQSLFYSLKIDVYFFLKKKHTFRNDVLHCIWKFWFNVCSKSKQEFGAESFCYLGCTNFSFKRKADNLPSFIWTDNDDVSIINSLYEKVKQDIHCVIR